MFLGYAFYINTFNYQETQHDSGNMFPPCQEQRFPPHNLFPKHCGNSYAAEQN